MKKAKNNYYLITLFLLLAACYSVKKHGDKCQYLPLININVCDYSDSVYVIERKHKYKNLYHQNVKYYIKNNCNYEFCVSYSIGNGIKVWEITEIINDSLGREIIRKNVKHKDGEYYYHLNNYWMVKDSIK